MKHLVTIMVDGQPMTASIRIGGDMTEDSDAIGEVTEAIDVEGVPYTYTETETPIVTPEMTDEEYLNMSVLKVIDKAVSHSTSV